MNSREEELKCCGNCQFMRCMDCGDQELVTYCLISEEGIGIPDLCNDWQYDGVSWEKRG